MPSDRDGSDTEQGRYRPNRQSLEFVHHDHRATTRRQCVQRAPQRGRGHQRALRVNADVGSTGSCVMVHPNLRPAPGVSLQVHEHPRQPRFFRGRAGGNPRQCAGHSQERVPYQAGRTLATQVGALSALLVTLLGCGGGEIASEAGLGGPPDSAMAAMMRSASHASPNYTSAARPTPASGRRPSRRLTRTGTSNISRNWPLLRCRSERPHQAVPYAAATGVALRCTVGPWVCLSRTFYRSDGAGQLGPQIASDLRAHFAGTAPRR